jgi:hypothetical protein
VGGVNRPKPPGVWRMAYGVWRMAYRSTLADIPHSEDADSWAYATAGKQVVELYVHHISKTVGFRMQ